MDLIKEALNNDLDLKAMLAPFNADPTSAPREIQKTMKDFALEEGILYRLIKTKTEVDTEGAVDLLKENM